MRYGARRFCVLLVVGTCMGAITPATADSSCTTFGCGGTDVGGDVIDPLLTRSHAMVVRTSSIPSADIMAVSVTTGGGKITARITTQGQQPYDPPSAAIAVPPPYTGLIHFAVFETADIEFDWALRPGGPTWYNYTGGARRSDGLAWFVASGWNAGRRVCGAGIYDPSATPIGGRETLDRGIQPMTAEPIVQLAGARFRFLPTTAVSCTLADGRTVVVSIPYAMPFAPAPNTVRIASSGQTVSSVLAVSALRVDYIVESPGLAKQSAILMQSIVDAWPDYAYAVGAVSGSPESVARPMCVARTLLTSDPPGPPQESCSVILPGTGDRLFNTALSFTAT